MDMMTAPINSIKNLRADATNLQLNKQGQYFYGHGKLLLSGEYLILDGAKGLALPTKLGQSLSVKYSQSFSPTLYWKSYDYEGNLWLEGKFEFWHFNILSEFETPELKVLQVLLRQARKQNFHFLRDEVDVHVETRLEFPLDWGLGSSSTLIYNIAQWAYISPFELLFNGMKKGSGYDIACAQSQGPIAYTKKENPHWETVLFEPSFVENLSFLYLGNKQNTAKAIDKYYLTKNTRQTNVNKVSQITDSLIKAQDITEFEKLIVEHEEIISAEIAEKRIKERHFSDFWGEVKSLGAWGGDFALITSSRPFEQTREYFASKGYYTLMPYKELILSNDNYLDRSFSSELLQ